MEILNVVGTKWGFYYITKSLAEHSRHNYTFKAPDNLSFNEANQYDVINCLNTHAWEILEGRWGKASAHRLAQTKKVICGAASKKSIARGLSTYRRVPFFFIRAPSLKMAAHLETRLDDPSIRVISLNCTDTIKFQPLNLPRIGFTVGWAGNYNREEKRTQWLHNLKYPLRIATVNHNYLHLNSHAAMNLFYNTVNAYVCVSLTEGAPVPMLEAMSAGLPVVSTDVGLAAELLESRWVFPDGSQEQVVKRVNRRLDELRKDENLWRETCARNRNKIVEEYSAKVVSAKWDKLFEE